MNEIYLNLHYFFEKLHFLIYSFNDISQRRLKKVYIRFMYLLILYIITVFEIVRTKIATKYQKNKMFFLFIQLLT